jgi:4-amino-4-deoxy-L-arabinose transferase-like glycosyltransferase
MEAPPLARRLLGVGAALLVTALLAPVYLRGLGATDIVGDDEAREVGIIQDMVLAGHWVLPRFNGTTFPDKPVLYHWLGAAACAARGRCDERAVRLPSALAALAVIALAGVTATYLFDVATGITAALLLGLTPALFHWARLARPDVLLTLLVAGALLTFYAWWRDETPSRGKAAALGLLLGLGILAKGPVAPTVAVIAIVAFLALRGQLRTLGGLLTPHCLAPAAVIGASWYVAALLGWGEAFVHAHVVRRYLGNVLGGDLALGVDPAHSLFHHLVFYPLHLLLMTLPWTPLLLGALYWTWRDPGRRRDPRLQLLQVWIGAVVVVFVPAALKLRHYLLPALPAAALLTAPFLADLLRRTEERMPQPTRHEPAPPVPIPARAQERPLVRAGSGLPAALAALAAVGGIAVWWATDGPSRSDRELARAILSAAAAEPSMAALTVAAGIVAGLAGVRAATRRRWRSLLAIAGAATLAWMLGVQPTAERALARVASLKPFAAVVERTVPVGAPLYFYGRVVRPLVVYLGRPVPRIRRHLGGVETGRGAYLIVAAADREQLRRLRPDARILAEHTGRVGNLARGRLALLEVPPRVGPRAAR